MNLCMVGCSHHQADLDARQQLAFGGQQAAEALQAWQNRFAEAEMVLLSTCNRVELYAASNAQADFPNAGQWAEAMAEFHGLSVESDKIPMATLADREVVDHLYRVASSLESMVVGEPQILSQVKEAYQSAQQCGTTGPLLNDLFQSAFRTAKRVAGETSLLKHRVSIPSVAIAEFARSVFERFDDKHILVIGAGEMADETLRYLRDAGAKKFHVVNRDTERGQQLAKKWNSQYHGWDMLDEQLVQADLVVSTTSATEPIVTAKRFQQQVAPDRHQRALLILDLAAPRDFQSKIGDALGIYLYSLDDLDQACQRNREARHQQLPAAEQIILEETSRFFVDANHRLAAPVISSLRRGLHKPKQAELDRLFTKLPDLDPRSRQEIEQFADRLVNKMLHPPLESLRDASQNGTPHSLLDALRRLFRLDE